MRIARPRFEQFQSLLHQFGCVRWTGRFADPNAVFFQELFRSRVRIAAGFPTAISAQEELLPEFGPDLPAAHGLRNILILGERPDRSTGKRFHDFGDDPGIEPSGRRLRGDFRFRGRRYGADDRSASWTGTASAGARRERWLGFVHQRWRLRPFCGRLSAPGTGRQQGPPKTAGNDAPDSQVSSKWMQRFHKIPDRAIS